MKMLIKWEDRNPPHGGGGKRKSGSSGYSILTATAILLVSMFALVTVSSGIPPSVSSPTIIGIPISGNAPELSEDMTGRRVPKQVGMPMGAAVNSETDHESAGTHHHGHGNGFMDSHGHHHHQHGHHGHGDGKYFMYAHSPNYDEYEYGYRRGNDYHFQERYEKYGPAWNFKTKVKWGDKYAGHGEHYWDYNHAGSHHDGGGGGGGDGGHGHYSEPVPTYEKQPGASSLHPRGHNKVAMINKRQSEERRKGDSADNKSSDRKVRKEKNYHTIFPDIGRERKIEVAESQQGVPVLVLDGESGQIANTPVVGSAYWLKPNTQPY